MKIWNKYKIIKEIKSNSNIKTYLTRIEPIVKEIIFKNREEYYIIIEIIEKLKKEFNIYEIIEENNKLYIVIDNNEEILYKVDKLFSNELDIEKEGILQGHGKPITKEEINELFKMEKAMCKISYETLEGKKGKGTGFFCKINNFPIKYALFSASHVLNKLNIDIGKTINFEYLENLTYVKKKIKIEENRKVFTNPVLDYTCIELLESDNIKNYFEIEPNLFMYNNNYLKDNDIFILQYPFGNDISFSLGKIKLIENNIIRHDASTEKGSSGSPIIRRSNNNCIIGLHYGYRKNKYNLGSIFESILYNIKQQYYSKINIKQQYNIINISEEYNKIICIYISNKYEREIKLLHDYNLDVNNINENLKKEYLEVKYINKKLFQENIEIYINDKKIKFDFKYKIKDSNEIRVKFIFKKILTNTSFMFYKCSSLKSIDLSSFKANNVINMSGMFLDCSSLESIQLSAFNTNNVNNMIALFSGCSSLKSIDLTSFNTNKVNNMSYMFCNCSSLESIDLSSFKTKNVFNMRDMFFNCYSLESINLSSFKTDNVIDMSGMFCGCSCLKSIDLSSFYINNVKNMSDMFSGCSLLKSINLSSFNTNDDQDISCIFFGCSLLKKENIIIEDKNDRLLNELF